MEILRVLKWLCVIIGALIGALGVVALLVLAPTSNHTAVNFTNLSEYVVWVYYVGILLAALTLFLPWVWSTVARIVSIRSEIARKVPLKRTHQIIAALIFLYALFLLVITISQFEDASGQAEFIPIPDWPLRLSVVVAITLLIGGPAVIGLWLGAFSAAAIRSFAANLPQRDDGSITWDEDHSIAVTRLADLAVLQKRLLAFLSAGVSSLILGPGLLRAAELAWNPKAPIQSSAYTLVTFGGLFTVFIAVSYAPTIIIGEDARKELLAKITPLPVKGEMVAEWCEHREVIERVLLPSNSLGTGVQVSIAVFAPIATALATSLYSLHLATWLSPGEQESCRAAPDT